MFARLWLENIVFNLYTTLIYWLISLNLKIVIVFYLMCTFLSSLFYMVSKYYTPFPFLTYFPVFCTNCFYNFTDLATLPVLIHFKWVNIAFHTFPTSWWIYLLFFDSQLSRPLSHFLHLFSCFFHVPFHLWLRLFWGSCCRIFWKGFVLLFYLNEVMCVKCV